MPLLSLSFSFTIRLQNSHTQLWESERKGPSLLRLQLGLDLLHHVVMLPRIVVLVRIRRTRQDRQCSGRCFLMRLLYFFTKSRELDRDCNWLGRVVDSGLEHAASPFCLSSDVVERSDATGRSGDGKRLGYGSGAQELI